jgi:hypothetical protein
LLYDRINQVHQVFIMQVSLSPTADKLISQIMTLGFNDPVAIIEVALERMAQEEWGAVEESPECLVRMQREVAIGAEQLERGEFSSLSPGEIKAEVLAEYQKRHSND